MDSPARFTRPALVFLIGVPLAWAVLLWFHPAVDRNDIYGTLKDDVGAYLVVHVGTLVFIGLIGLALYMLVRELPGRAAKISRLAIGPFVLFYAAWEAVIGLGVGAIVEDANQASAIQQAAVEESLQALQSNAIIGDPSIVGGLGALAWIVAVLAAAVAYRRSGAPVAAVVLLGLSLVIISHPPPIGPIGLLCFAGAVGLLARHERVSSRLEAAVPAPTPEVAATA